MNSPTNQKGIPLVLTHSHFAVLAKEQMAICGLAGGLLIYTYAWRLAQSHLTSRVRPIGGGGLACLFQSEKPRRIGGWEVRQIDFLEPAFIVSHVSLLSSHSKRSSRKGRLSLLSGHLEFCFPWYKPKSDIFSFRVWLQKTYFAACRPAGAQAPCHEPRLWKCG